MIKPAISRSVIFILLLVITNSCFIKTTYSVRIVNNYPDQIDNVKVGPANFGNISSGATSSYIEINEGSNGMSGYDHVHSNIKLVGTVSMTGGHGKNTGTVTINNDGSLALVIDKK